MIILRLNPYEIMTLSSHSKIRVSENSPLIGHYAMEMIDFDQKGYQVAYQSCIEDGFLVQEGEDYTLAKEMEPLMLLLNHPEVTVSIKRAREVSINEVDITLNKGFWLHYVKSALDNEHTLTYPHYVESIGAWIRKEGFANLEFEGEALRPYEVKFTMEEMLAIFIYFSFIKHRFHHSGNTLEVEDTYVSIESIYNFSKFEEFDGMMIGQVSQDEMKAFIRDSMAMKEAVDKLIGGGVFIEHNQTVTLADYYKKLMDPGKISDTFYIGEHLRDTTKFMTLFVTRGGYMLMQTHDSQNEGNHVELKVYPSSTDLGDLFRDLCPNAFPNGFGDEKRYEATIKEKMAKVDLQ